MEQDHRLFDVVRIHTCEDQATTGVIVAINPGLHGEAEPVYQVRNDATGRSVMLSSADIESTGRSAAPFRVGERVCVRAAGTLRGRRFIGHEGTVRDVAIERGGYVLWLEFDGYPQRIAFHDDELEPMVAAVAVHA